MTKLLIRTLLILVAGALVAGGYFVWQQIPQEQQDFALAEVMRGDLVVKTHLRGELRAVRSLTLTAPNIGMMSQITQLASTGALARRGDLIFELDDSERVAAPGGQPPFRGADPGEPQEGRGGTRHPQEPGRGRDRPGELPGPPGRAGGQAQRAAGRHRRPQERAHAGGGPAPEGEARGGHQEPAAAARGGAGRAAGAAEQGRARRGPGPPPDRGVAQAFAADGARVDPPEPVRRARRIRPVSARDPRGRPDLRRHAGRAAPGPFRDGAADAGRGVGARQPARRPGRRDPA